MEKYCEVCKQMVETKIIDQRESYKVFGETLEVDARVLVCAKCGEELFSAELDNETILKVYNEYRRRHKLLLPEEIRAIREQYGLSQRSFAKLLNWGDKTIFRYESGSVQDRAHNSLLLRLRNPENMRSYITANDVLITPRQKERLLERINRLTSRF